jgi:hypothetical protein
MRFYARFLIAAETETYSAAEVEKLRSCVASAPGVEEVTRVSKHFKGGYDVAVQLTESSVQTEDPVRTFLEFLWKEGYRPAI